MLSPSILSGFDKGQNAIELTNLVPFDIAVPGNHEFDFGPANFFEKLVASAYPWTAINITNADDSAIAGLGGVMTNAGGGNLVANGVMSFIEISGGVTAKVEGWLTRLGG